MPADPPPLMSPPHDRLELLLAQHEQFLTQTQECINRDIAAVDDGPHKAFLSILSSRLGAHQAWLQKTKRDELNTAGDAVQWGAITVTRKPQKGKRVILRIAGPATGDEYTITVEDEEAAQKTDAQIQQYDKMSKALARAASQALAVAELRKAGGGSAKQQLAVDADQTRIPLLKQYNDLRDVAQELIGVIADNRLVSVRSLYADGGFGVGADD